MASKPPSSGRLPGGSSSSAGYYKVTDGLRNPPRGPTIGPAPEGIFRFRSDIEKNAQSSGVSAAQVTAFFRMLEENKGPLKTTLSVIKTADNAIKFAKFCYQLERWGYSVSEIVQVLVLAGSIQSSRFAAFMDYFLRSGDRLSKLFAKTKGARNGLGYLLLVVTVYTSLADKEYGQAAAKTYKFVMGKAIPWAGAIDTLQSFMPAPTAQSNAVFKIMRACDPIGLGGVAVDSFVVMVQSLIDAATGKPFDDKRLGQLVERMKSGPTRIFAELGERAGDALYDISEMDSQDWKLVGRYTYDQLSEFVRGVGR